MAEMAKTFPSGQGTTDILPSAGIRPPGAGVESPSIGAQTSWGQGESKQGAGAVAGQAKEIVSQQVSQRAGRSADDLDQVARALRQTREQLSGNVAAPYVDKAARQIERLSSFLRTADAREVVRSAESFARREPLLFLGGAFTLGILAARFLKSSARHGGEEQAYRGGDPRSIARREYPPATTEPRSDISHAAAGPRSDDPGRSQPDYSGGAQAEFGGGTRGTT